MLTCKLIAIMYSNGLCLISDLPLAYVHQPFGVTINARTFMFFVL